ncbi:hypothetical protein BTJ45_04579 [Bacillus mycoides]|nr:hypothetical protein BTJ45_04579 [Bacillus mycoides]
MKNLSASAVTKERSTSRGYNGLKIVCIVFLKSIQGVKSGGI